jgi:hypothetical protein
LHGLQNGRSQIQFFKFHDGAPKRRMASVCQAVWKQPPVIDRWDSQVGMETTGDSLGQTPAEVLMLRQLEAATGRLSHVSVNSQINSKG